MTFLTVLTFSMIFCISTIKDTYNRTDKNPFMFKIDEKVWNTTEVRAFVKVLVEASLVLFQGFLVVSAF